jgi:hypothetical protein
MKESGEPEPFIKEIIRKIKTDPEIIAAIKKVKMEIKV